MKLDKIKFASLVAMLTNFGASLDSYRIQDIDDMIDIDVPANINKVTQDDVNELLRQLNAPDGFISAIKAYRMLTGAGLKESKEAIEHYRSVPKFPVKEEGATLGDILKQAPKFK